MEFKKHSQISKNCKGYFDNHENVTAILELMAHLRRQRLYHDNAPNLSTQKDHTNCFSDIG